jgi:cytochrome c556
MKSALGGLAIFFVATTALAHSGATGVVKERMDMMKDLGGAMKVLVQQSNEHNFEKAQVLHARRTIIDHADHLADLFPVGSDTKPSEAAPAIWTDKDRFDGLFGDMREAAVRLSTGPELKPLKEQVNEIVATCKECHQEFRVKQ